MSETAGHASLPVPPKLIVSRPADELANKARHRNVASRVRRTSPDTPRKEQGQSSSSEWSDIEESPPRRRRSSRRSSDQRSKAYRPSQDSSTIHRSEDSQLGRYFPRLSRILEVNESTTSSRPSTRSSEHRRHRGSSPRRRARNRDDSRSSYRRPVKHRTGGVQKRNGSLLEINPSLLSVLSSLTGISDRSSGSNSTITQQSYDRRDSDSSKTTTGRPRRSMSEVSSTFSKHSRPRSPNVFDYIVASTVDADHDVMSSSASSHYEASVAGSSDAPDTPSSRSTFPSPTSTRSQSVAELRRKYDPQYSGSFRCDSHSPESSIRSLRHQPSVSDVAEADDVAVLEPTAPSELSCDPQRRSSSRSSRSSQRSTERVRKQEESMREHIAYADNQQQGHYVDPAYGQHRSLSASSAQSEHAAYLHHMAMQRYQWTSPPAVNPYPPPAHGVSGHIVNPERPPAPDAPDLNQRTLAGYEMLALELASSNETVKPLYRKFEYLNHRILLHLQDELSELEEQLRTLDEIIAQMDPALAEGHRTPASRRGEAYGGSDIHHQRTGLLGRIFVKTEQYNRAVASYMSIAKDTSSPDYEQVQAYRQWMAKHAPVHEVETRFLQRREDLMVPRAVTPPHFDRPTKHAALAYLPVALMLPLLLFSVIPTLSGRLVVTALIAVGAFIVTATTRIRHLMPPREWAVCGAAYVLLMAAIAGCIPQYTT